MKYIIIVPDGMADEPVTELGDKTPLQVAHTTNMDYLAQNGFVGLVQTIPAKMPPGSDIGNLAMLGYNPKKHFSGRAALEAANLNITLANDEIVFRCNLVTISNGKMADYSAGHISTKEAAPIIETLNKEIDIPGVKFYAGKSYRHLVVIKTNKKELLAKIKCAPPHDISGQDIKRYLPGGRQAEILLRLMEHSKKILENHSINQVRLDLKENPANMIWLWGQGTRPHLPSFEERFGIKGSVISAVDLVNGIGKLTGLDVITVPGATGYYDTNYAGKAQAALDSLKKKDFVFVHIEAPDEAGHNGDFKMKTACIERIDREIVGPILNHFDKHSDFRILIAPDHPTPVKKRTHTSDPVCFVMYGKGIINDSAQEYNEITAQQKGLKFQSGEALIEYFIKG
ncbi:MAG: cofactor-independent phosphoglycerate mutase [Candidatus Omnitrophota bacterium]